MSSLESVEPLVVPSWTAVDTEEALRLLRDDAAWEHHVLKRDVRVSMRSVPHEEEHHRKDGAEEEEEEKGTGKSEKEEEKKSRVMMVRGVTTVPYPPHLVQTVNDDVEFRKSWDDSMLECTFLQKIGDEEAGGSILRDVWYMLIKTPIISNREFVHYSCLIPYVTVPGSFLSISKSGRHPAKPIPPPKGKFIRGETKVWVLLVEPVEGNPDQTKISVLSYVDFGLKKAPRMVLDHLTKKAPLRFRKNLVKGCSLWLKKGKK
jgi:hypothetical protein